MASRDATSWPEDRLDPPDAERGAGRSVVSTVLRVVGGLVVAASFGVWVYAYSGQADRPPPDLLADTELALRAEAICLAAVTDVEAMPSAPDAADGVDRADQVRRSTARFDTMLADLRSLRVDDPDDRVIMSGFLADWGVLLDDRLRYATAVAEDGDTVFLLTKVAEAERLDRRLTRVANTNRMPSCGNPTDVG